MWVRFMAFLATIIFIAVGGLLLLGLEGGFISLNDIFFFLESSYSNLKGHLVIISIGLGLFALGIFNVYLAFLSLRRKSFVAVKGSQGDIQIAYRTIEEIVENVARNIGGIEKVSTRIIRGRKRISLVVKLFLGNVKNVIDISQRVQEFIRDEIENVLGIKNLKEVRVLIRRIALEKPKRYEDILEERRSSRGIELR